MAIKIDIDALKGEQRDLYAAKGMLVDDMERVNRRLAEIKSQLQGYDAGQKSLMGDAADPGETEG